MVVKVEEVQGCTGLGQNELAALRLQLVGDRLDGLGRNAKRDVVTRSLTRDVRADQGEPGDSQPDESLIVSFGIRPPQDRDIEQVSKETRRSGRIPDDQRDVSNWPEHTCLPSDASIERRSEYSTLPAGTPKVFESTGHTSGLKSACRWFRFRPRGTTRHFVGLSQSPFQVRQIAELRRFTRSLSCALGSGQPAKLH